MKPTATKVETGEVVWEPVITCMKDIPMPTAKEIRACEASYRRGYTQGFAKAQEMAERRQQLGLAYEKLFWWRTYNRRKGCPYLPEEALKMTLKQLHKLGENEEK